MGVHMTLGVLAIASGADQMNQRRRNLQCPSPGRKRPMQRSGAVSRAAGRGMQILTSSLPPLFLAKNLTTKPYLPTPVSTPNLMRANSFLNAKENR
jgi:hypothetical protein